MSFFNIAVNWGILIFFSERKPCKIVVSGVLFCWIFKIYYGLFSYVTQGDGDQERLKRQQELSAVNLYQLQQLQYQYLLRYVL